MMGAGFFFYKFGLMFFIKFPYTLLFSSITILWISAVVLYYGKFVAKWGMRNFLIYLVIVGITIPIATNLHISYLDWSAEKALHNFIATINEGNSREKYTVDSLEGLKCLSEDVSLNYSVRDDYFMGVYDWWIKFENGAEYYIITERVNLSFWDVSIICPFERSN